MRAFRLVLLVVICLAAADATMAAQVIAPATLPETGGLSSGLRALPRQYMEYIDESQIAGVGADPILITGFQLRLAAIAQPSIGAAPPATWPPADRTFSQFHVELSKPSAVITGAAGGAQFPALTNTWASHQVGAVTTYDGAYTIPASSFSWTSAALPDTNAFGALINFQTPYSYTPGDGLVLYIRHGGFGGTENVFFATCDFTPEGADAISRLDNTGTTPDALTSPYIIQFTYSAVPEPASLTVIGLAGLAMLRRR